MIAAAGFLDGQMAIRTELDVFSALSGFFLLRSHSSLGLFVGFLKALVEFASHGTVPRYSVRVAAFGAAIFAGYNWAGFSLGMDLATLAI